MKKKYPVVHREAKQIEDKVTELIVTTDFMTLMQIKREYNANWVMHINERCFSPYPFFT